MKDPRNGLERAYAVALGGPEGAPELFRQLRESTVRFLIAYHPELDGEELEPADGDRIMFKVWEKGGETLVPIFTSLERAQEAIKHFGGNCSVGKIRGEQLFMALAYEDLEVAINLESGMDEMILPVETVKGLADGSILKPVAPRPGVYGTVRGVDPADYPTDFIEPVFRFLSGRREVCGAWLFRQTDAPDPNRVAHVIGLWVRGGRKVAQRLEYDLTIVAKQACPPNDEFGVMMLDPKNPAMARFMGMLRPFYASADFRVPGR